MKINADVQLSKLIAFYTCNCHPLRFIHGSALLYHAAHLSLHLHMHEEGLSVGVSIAAATP